MGTSAPAATARDWRRVGTGCALPQRLGHILETGLWSDVTLIVGKNREVFKVHKVILRTGSKIFDDLFNADERRHSFEVTDLEPEEFSLLLKYLYTGEFPESDSKNFLPLLKAAAVYEISELVGMCGDLIGNTINEHNMLLIYQYAVKYGDVGLKEVALKFICRFGYRMIRSGGFLELSINELTTILARDDLEIPDECVLYESVVSWGKAERRRQKFPETGIYLRSVLEEVLKFVRFPTMDATDFALKVVSNELLRTEEVVSIMLHISVSPYYKSELPNCVFNTQPRAPYVPRGPELVLARLARFGTYLRLKDHRQSIRLKPSIPLWVTSIGVTCTYLFCLSSNVAMQIDIEDADKKRMASETDNELHKNKTHAFEPKVFHIKFSTPVYLRKDHWYTLSCTAISGYFFYNCYSKDGDDITLGYQLIGEGPEDIVKIEVERTDKSPGIHGFIPEIGFMIE